MESKLIHQQNGRRVFDLVFKPGDELIGGVEEFCKKKLLSPSRCQGEGRLKNLTLAYEDAENKEKEINMEEVVDVISLQGKISVKEGHPQIHAHVMVTKPDASAFGGYLLRGTVVSDFNMMVEELPDYLY